MVDVNVNFVLGNDEPLRADFELQPDVTYNADIRLSDATRDHTKLYNRDRANQHPMGAITGLEEALEGLSDDITAENNRAVEAEEALDNKIDLEADTRADEITRVEDLISDEETRASEAETTLRANITAEENRAKGVEQQLSSSIDSNHQAISNHVSDKNNPHEVTKAQVGLGNVENLSPSDMPVSTATQTALDTKVDKVSTVNRVYGTDAQGNQTTYDKGSFGQVDDVRVGGTSVVTNKIANLGTMAGETASDYPTLAGNNIFTGTEVINQGRDGGQTVIDINRGDIVMTHTPSGETLPTGVGFYNSFSLSVSEYPTSGESFDFSTNGGGTTANYNDTDGNQTSFNVGAGSIDASIYGNDVDVYAYMNDSGVYVSTPTGSDDEEVVNVGYANAHYATTAQGTLADTALQPNDNISELTNNLNYQTATQVANSIAVETNNRESADNNLQSQIDAIVSASDVFDIVGTYAELQAYDISTVPVNDIIKVLVDSTHAGAATYYRCVESGGVKSWSYIGSEGAYYTKGEADNKFVPQTRTVNNKALSSNIALTASDVGALPSSTVIPTVNNGQLDIQVNGSSIATFTANQSGNTTADITIPSSLPDQTGNEGKYLKTDGTDASWQYGARYIGSNYSSKTYIGDFMIASGQNPNSANALYLRTDDVPAGSVPWSNSIKLMANNYITSFCWTSDTSVDMPLLGQQSVQNVGWLYTAKSGFEPTMNSTTGLLKVPGGIYGYSPDSAFGATAFSNDYSDLDNLPNYGAGLSYSSSSLQLLDQNGNNLGSAVTIKSTPDLDGVTIDTNSSDELEAIGTVNQNTASGATTVKYDWIGTLAEYNAQNVETLHPEWVCFITDDVSGGTSVYTKTEVDNAISTALTTMLDSAFPVGSRYITEASTCPLATLIPNSTWVLTSQGRVLQGADSNHASGTTAEAGLPNITGSFKVAGPNGGIDTQDGAFYKGDSTNTQFINSTMSTNSGVSKGYFDAARSNPIYGNSTTVQPPAEFVNIFKRTA